MFGIIRSSSSLDSLERPSSKILKDDSLSIYEATLRTLKLGSQHDSSPPTKDFEASNNPAKSSRSSHELTNSLKEDFMTVDSDSPTTRTCTTEASGDRERNFSILFLFSRFKKSPESSPVMEEAATIEDVCSAGISSSRASHSTDSIELHSEQESIVIL